MRIAVIQFAPKVLPSAALRIPVSIRGHRSDKYKTISTGLRRYANSMFHYIAPYGAETDRPVRMLRRLRPNTVDLVCLPEMIFTGTPPSYQQMLVKGGRLGIDIDSTGRKETFHIPPMDRDEFRASMLSPLSSLFRHTSACHSSWRKRNLLQYLLASLHVYMEFSLELAVLAPSTSIQWSFRDFLFRASGITFITLILSKNKEARTTFAMLISPSRKSRSAQPPT